MIRSPEDMAVAIINTRKQLGLTQLEVANLVGLKQKTISAFENNPEGTKLKTVFRILAALRLELEPRDRINKDTGWTQEW